MKVRFWPAFTTGFITCGFTVGIIQGRVWDWTDAVMAFLLVCNVVLIVREAK